jgi:hypothetical protein
MLKTLSLIVVIVASAFHCAIGASDERDALIETLRSDRVSYIKLLYLAETAESSHAIDPALLDDMADARVLISGPRLKGAADRLADVIEGSERSEAPSDRRWGALGLNLRWGCLVFGQNGALLHSIYLDIRKGKGTIDAHPYRLPPTFIEFLSEMRRTAPQASNHAMQRTAGRSAFPLFDDFHIQPAATCGLASGR